jgi:hypothetical protein
VATFEERGMAKNINLLYGFKMGSNVHDYLLAQKVARAAGLLRTFDRVSSNLDKALVFAQSFDKEANRKT